MRLDDIKYLELSTLIIASMYIAALKVWLARLGIIRYEITVWLTRNFH